MDRKLRVQDVHADVQHERERHADGERAARRPRSASGYAGALRAAGGLGGHVGAPIINWRVMTSCQVPCFTATSRSWPTRTKPRRSCRASDGALTAVMRAM